MKKPPGFYVYVYYDPETNEPFYVGKGQKHRATKHLHQCHNRLVAMKIKSIRESGAQPRIEVLLPGSSEEEAFEFERYLIATYGRRDDGTGPLFNMAEGGGLATAGFTGRRHSEESRRKMSEARKGKPKSEETKRKMREAGLKRDVSHLHSEENTLKRLATTRSSEHREKLSMIAKLTVSKERLVEITEKARIRNTGITRSPETRAKMSAASKNRIVSDETRKRMSAAQRRRYARTDD